MPMTTREVANRTGILVLIAIVVGALGAVIWSRVAVLPPFVVEADGHANISEVDMGHVASADWSYAIIALVGGAALGYATWRLLRGVGWPVALITAGIALVAGITCWILGESLGPEGFDQRISEAVAGDSVPVALMLHARSALALWPFAAVAVPLFAASLGPEVDAEGDTTPWPAADGEVSEASPAAQG